jgi:hypothetical protein
VDALFTPAAAVAAAAVGAWLLVYAAVLYVTRPDRIDAGPATQEFGGEEPPAVVSMLANGWRVTVDAVESTLLDLAARGLIELRQPADNPRETTIHLPSGDGSGSGPPKPGPARLNGYEAQLLDRVRGLAKGGVLPISALTFRDDAAAATWAGSFDALVRKDAAARGLSRPRISPPAKGFLTVLALGPAVLVAIAAGVADTEDPGTAMTGSGVVAFGVLTAIAGRYRGERPTPEGRTVARRWLALRRYLRGDEAFGRLPPAAVAVWDRYLPYGTALGVNHVCSAVLDLGMGDRRLVWSSFGGTWHRVRVRYPRYWGRYGRTATSLGTHAVLALVAGGVLLWFSGDLRRALEEGPTAGPGIRDTADQAVTGLLAVGVLLLVRGGYRLVRTIVDVAVPRELTGELLWCEPWRTQKPSGENATPVPWLHYLAVDDGRGDTTRAWGLPSALAGRVEPGTVARLVVRSWSRRVLVLEPIPSPEGPVSAG